MSERLQGALVLMLGWVITGAILFGIPALLAAGVGCLFGLPNPQLIGIAGGGLFTVGWAILSLTMDE